MKEYNYDYINLASDIVNGIYPDNLSSNYMQGMPGKMDYTNGMNNNFMNMPSSGNTFANMQGGKDNISDIYKGFLRGNLFDNLYDQYKNYKPKDLNPSNEREALLEQWQQYNFALVELDLYLDVYPNDMNAVNLYKKYLDISKQITKKYESMYGPLCLDSEYVAGNNWNWNNGPWPWEGVK